MELIDQRHLSPAILLMGPTASGKTDLAVHLVERLPLEIVSVDSAQVYRGMDIGTAKPEPEVLARAPHRLIDIRDPSEPYSAAEFRTDALNAMAEIRASGKIPLLVGGTGLYFRALLSGLSPLPAADFEVRMRLTQEAGVQGWRYMHRRLEQVDPAAARRIHPNDPQRIQRALEVYELTGRRISELQGESRGTTLPYRILKLARAPRDRNALRERIATRFHAMLDRGLEAEVRALLSRADLGPSATTLRSVGYRQMVSYLLGEWDYETMVERGIIATRQLAKRQLTWLRAEADVCWLFDEDRDVYTSALGSVRELIRKGPLLSKYASSRLS